MVVNYNHVDIVTSSINETDYTNIKGSWVDGKYKTRIYETETMKEDSFVEVVSFDYEIPPLTFDKAGDDFYVSMGGKKYTTSAKNGITLKVSVE